MTKTAETQNGGSGSIRPNPVRAFETTAKRIWDSQGSQEEKQAKLAGLGAAINSYIGKVDDLLASKKMDVWVRLSINRSKVYLEQLASDVLMLSSTAPRGT